MQNLEPVSITSVSQNLENVSSKQLVEIYKQQVSQTRAVLNSRREAIIIELKEIEEALGVFQPSRPAQGTGIRIPDSEAVEAIKLRGSIRADELAKALDITVQQARTKLTNMHQKKLVRLIARGLYGLPVESTRFDDAIINPVVIAESSDANTNS